jgi:hypothetical protein
VDSLERLFQTAIQPTGMLQPLLPFAALAAIFAALISLDEERIQKMHLSSSIQPCNASDSVLQIRQPYSINFTTVSIEGIYLLPSNVSRIMGRIYA